MHGGICLHVHFWVFGEKKKETISWISTKIKKKKRKENENRWQEQHNTCLPPPHRDQSRCCFNKAACWGIVWAWKQCTVAARAAALLSGPPRQPSLITRTVKTHYCSPNGGICPRQLFSLVFPCAQVRPPTATSFGWLGAQTSPGLMLPVVAWPGQVNHLGSIVSSLSLFDLQSHM